MGETDLAIPKTRQCELRELQSFRLFTELLLPIQLDER
jgi:hypothetical protein